MATSGPNNLPRNAYSTQVCVNVCLYMDLYIPPYRINNEKIYTNKRSSIKATSNSKSRAIDIAAKCRMFTTRSLSSRVVLSSTTDLLILRHKIDYVTSLNVDFRRLYITRHRDLGTSITRIVCCLPTVGSNNYYNLLTHCIVISHERYIVRSNIRVKAGFHSEK